MAIIDVYGIDSIDARRLDDEEASLQLVIKIEDGTRINIGAGRFHDDACTLEKMLRDAADSMAEVVRDWQDVPDEHDGFVSEDRGRYYVSLEGAAWQDDTLHASYTRSNWRPKGFPTQEIATYELARAMSDAGCFPNAWYQGERGWTDDIGADVLAYQEPDEANGTMIVRPLVGVTYEDGDEVRATITYAGGETGTHSASVVRDYGTLGIVYVLSGDDEERFTDDRDTITPAAEEGDE